jgi:hypothetical protein
VNFAETGFIDVTDFNFVRYLVANKCLLNKNRFRFQGKVDKAGRTCVIFALISILPLWDQRAGIKMIRDSWQKINFFKKLYKIRDILKSDLFSPGVKTRSNPHLERTHPTFLHTFFISQQLLSCSSNSQRLMKHKRSFLNSQKPPQALAIRQPDKFNFKTPYLTFFRTGIILPSTPRSS